MVYLDNSATTKPSKICVDSINRILNDNWFNPSSLYDLGADIEFELNISRKKFADVLKCNKNNIIFTSGGTESNNLAIFGSLFRHRLKKGKIVTTAVEHKSVIKAFKVLENDGFEVVFVKPDKYGDISVDEFLKNIDQDVIFTSCMSVNNEIGSIFDVFSLSKEIKKISPNCIFHCDATQSLLKQEINLNNSFIDLMTFSGHKVFCPKGIGALYVKHIDKLDPIIYGANQEYGVRAGTENTAFAIAFCENICLYYNQLTQNYEHIKTLFNRLYDGIKNIDGVEFNLPKYHSEYINNIWVKGINSETVLHFLENKGIYVSSGSSCNRGQKSYVLEFLENGDLKSTQSIRVSFCKDNTIEDVDKFLDALKDAVNKLVKVR